MQQPCIHCVKSNRPRVNCFVKKQEDDTVLHVKQENYGEVGADHVCDVQ